MTIPAPFRLPAAGEGHFFGFSDGAKGVFEPEWAISGRFLVRSAISGRTLGIRRQQPPTRQHEIGEAKQRQHLRRVLRQSPVAGLAVTEQVLHHMKGMLHLGADAGLGLFDPF